MFGLPHRWVLRFRHHRYALPRAALLVAAFAIGLGGLIAAKPLAATQPPVEVRVQQAVRESVHATIEYAGRLRPQRVVTHRAGITGIVDQVRVAPGDYVHADETLMTLHRRTASSDFRPVAVTARIEGTVTELLVSSGDELREGDEVAAIADTSAFVAQLFVSDKDVDAVVRGDRVTARDPQRGVEFTGRVSRAALVPDYRSGLFPVEVTVNPAQGGFIGQFLRFEFETGRSSGILVEREHLVMRRGAYHLFVVSDGVAELRRVELGDEFGEMVMIHNGLAEGERFVVWSRGRLQDGQRVTVSGEDNA